jgi:putative PIN family toxin of toxin-antitoxin system
VRIVLDTNVLVSAVATRGLCADLFNLVLAEHELILGEKVLSELKRILRQKIRLPAKLIDEYDGLLRQEALLVKEAEILALKIRDRDDLLVLSEAVAGGAEILVSGDRDLLDVEQRLPIQILTPRGLWERLRGNPSPT